MRYLVYKITNTANGKIYIGSHKTIDIDDGYMGSGKYLKRAQSKYGLDKFQKEILFEFDNAESMFQKEKELVTLGKHSYNLKSGGEGGFDYINKNQKNGSSLGVKRRTELLNDPVWKEGFLLKQKAGFDRFLQSDIFPQAIERGIQTKKERYPYGNKTFLGKHHSEESKNKIRRSLEGKRVGSGNSQFGTMWITDGNTNRKMLKTDAIPNGWQRGRKI